MPPLETSDYDYFLPQDLIAQTPVEARDRSRLMVINRAAGSLGHYHFFELPDLLKSGDVLVFNNSRVIRARLFGNRTDTGRRIEILLLRRLEPKIWECLIGSKKRVFPGMQVDLEGQGEFKAQLLNVRENGIRVVRLSDDSALPEIGKVPLPPYIHTPLTDPERYQTVYADKEGSVAAPTAGLHFTPRLIEEMKNSGVICLFVTLHVGLNTFRPVQVEDALKHPIFPEYGVIDEEAAAEINKAKTEGRRVICVGTTSVRLIESAAHATSSVIGSNSAFPEASPAIAGRPSPVSPFFSFVSPLTGENEREGASPIPHPWDGWVNDFIYPGYRFKITDAMVTNFHLPKSTLLMLVSAFAGRDLVFKAYKEAIEQRYRFYSFGDAMLII
jgi:S-adenosylmethionine:tRNA ribosyltransferase-isomerase